MLPPVGSELLSGRVPLQVGEVVRRELVRTTWTLPSHLLLRPQLINHYSWKRKADGIGKITVRVAKLTRYFASEFFFCFKLHRQWSHRASTLTALQEGNSNDWSGSTRAYDEPYPKGNHESSHPNSLGLKAAALLASGTNAYVVAKTSAKETHNIKSRSCCWKQSKLEWQAMTMQEFGPNTAKGCCYGF